MHTTQQQGQDMQQNTVYYKVAPADPHHHYFDVSLQFFVATPQSVLLRMPAWLPGSYMIRDFGKHVISFSAIGAEVALDYIRPDKSSWLLEECSGWVTVHYCVYAFDLSVRTAWLDSEFGFFNPSAVCLEAPEFNELPHELMVPPIDNKDWHLATGMPLVEADKSGFGTYTASSYAELIDYPFLMGPLTEVAFTAKNIPHRLVLVGRHFANTTQLANDLQRICEQQIEFWNHAPFTEYSFLTMVVGEGFGGLEHRNSTALICSRHSLEPVLNNSTNNDDYNTFLSLCSHEYLHSWNIKQLRPSLFHPYNLTQEQYTEQLWFYEGVTSYLDDYFLQQSGVLPAQQYLARVGQTMSRALRGKGPQRQSVLTSSQLAWTTFYQQNENAQNAISSYYSKGAVIAMLLDLATRMASDQQRSLMDIMRCVYERYAAIGTKQENLIKVIAEVANPAIAEQVQDWLTSTQPLPVDVVLERFGIQLAPTCADAFSMQPSLTGTSVGSVSLGAALQERNGSIVISRVFEDGAAALAELSANDTLVAIDFLHANRGNINRAITRYQPGETVQVHVLRDDRLLEKSLTWQAPKADCYQLSISNAELAQLWLKLP
ncbi:M61 family metallopeptidase [Aliidiomarina sp.]|uniref:M61 family metallopeptidase n=1 Tax=Aliidiomarina sp. TaxID=1872439 RepID=UPI003A4E268B